MKSIDRIYEYEKGNLSVLKDCKWLMYLALSEQQNVNYEYIKSMDQLNENRLLNYVKKSLLILEDYTLDQDVFDLLQEILQWSEVAKGGMLHHRERWLDHGYNLFAHNIGSASIYAEIQKDYRNPIVETLINTHGLIGQYIRGEVPLNHSASLLTLVKDNGVSIEKLSHILMVLNHCIIGAVSTNLWLEVKEAVSLAIKQLFEDSNDTRSITERLELLRSKAILGGEDFNLCFNQACQRLSDIDQNLVLLLEALVNSREIWYFEAALNDFNFDEVIKILLIVYQQIEKLKVKHISFETIMKDIYYDYEGQKKVNLYKKRIVENYLSKLSYKEILSGRIQENPHLTIHCKSHSVCNDTVFAVFEFSVAAQKLIDFCVEAERASLGYERAVVLLYDYFGLRKDKYDRFHNEESYLKTMNQSIDYKSVILDYIVGQHVIDIGPGGGALMDLIEENKPGIQVTGIDISSNVIEALSKKKKVEQRKWHVQYGDALNLKEDVETGSVDTIIFCSIIHELYSYIEYEGYTFNHNVIGKALESAFTVLSPGGRIIIRDGIMTEPEDQKRKIVFSSSEGMNFLERYSKDFKGRQIMYEIVGHNSVTMTVNDAMEFLYTYTWGEDSYGHEINEQFGYFTPTKYTAFIRKTLGDQAKIIISKHYLQAGYTAALEPKVKIYDQSGNICDLPDSTCLIVIEKIS